MANFAVATLNLRNLQLAGQPRYPGSEPYTDAEYQAKLNWIAAAIKEADADLIGFQELWSRQALADAFQQANLSGDYQLVAPPANAPNRIWNALAVRNAHRVESSSYISALPDQLKLKKGPSGDPADEGLPISVDTQRFSREVLRATVRLFDPDGNDPASEVRVLVAHLKSKNPMRLDDDVENGPGVIAPDRAAIGSALATIKRTAEAAGLRILVSREQRDDADDDGAGRPVIVLGDLNDAQLSNTLHLLTTQPRYRLEPASRVGSSSKWGLYSVATLQELRSLRDVYYTYIHEGFRESLDHILVSQHFYDYSRHLVWSLEHMQIFNDHLESAGKGNDNAVPASDHGVVRAEFRSVS